MILSIGVTVQISSPSGKWYQFAVGRWVTGLGVGGLSLIVPMYQAESGPRHIRGSLIRYALTLYWICFQIYEPIPDLLQHISAVYHVGNLHRELYQLRNRETHKY